MDGTVVYVLVIVLIALTFDFINGFHDSANSIATVVSTRVLSPGVAVFWAAFFNFIAAFIVGTAVAKTIGKGLIVVDVVDPSVILGGLIGAIVWDLVTWWGGLPSSSSHALLGGLCRRGDRQGRLRRPHSGRLDPASPVHPDLAAPGHGGLPAPHGGSVLGPA